MVKSMWSFLIVIGLITLGTMGLFAQSTITGAISGTVTDPSGGVIAGAMITAKNTSTGVAEQTTTNASGSYQFTALQPSQYVVTATASSFGVTTTNAVVYVGQTTAVNFRLSLSTTHETFRVSAETVPTLQTNNGNVSTTLSETQVQQVPVPGNDINALPQMAPGAVMTGDTFPAIYGMPTNSNLLISNGMEDIDPFDNSTNGGASNLLLGLNEVKEATVTPTGYTGEYGYLAGSNITIVTKSGSNQFHGNAKYFWNGRALNANDYFNNASDTPRPFVNVNQWAASVGGPIKQNKLFFFVDTEGIRLVLPTSSLAIIPSQQFEAATIETLQNLGLTNSIPFYCQNLTLTDASGKAVICPAGVSGAGQGIFNLYNTSLGASRAVVGNGNPEDPTGCNGFTGLGAGVPCALEYRSTAGNFNPEWMIAGRVDWDISSSDHAFVHFRYDDGTQATYTDPINLLFNADSAQRVEDSQVGWTHLMGTSAVNEFSASLEHFHILFGAVNPAATLAAFPTTLAFGDGTFTTLGGEDNVFPFILALMDYHFADNYTKTIGNHSLKAGADIERYDVGNSYLSGTTGYLVPTTVDAFFNGGVDSANPSTDFTTLTNTFTQNGFEPIASYHTGGFLQDAWHVRSNLMLTLGFRVDHPSNPVCQHNCFARTVVPFSELDHNPDIPYNQAIQTGLRQSLYNLQTLEWSPRFGFSWQPFGISKATVVRGGVGIFYDTLPINIGFGLAQNSPLINTFIAGQGNLAPTQNNNLFAQTAADNQAFLTGFSQGLTVGQLETAVPNFAPPALYGVDGKMPETQVQKWSVEVQQGLWRNAALTIGYFGNHMIHGWIQDGSVNAYAADFVGLPSTAPDPRFGQVTTAETDAVSNYNGMTLSLADRFASGVLQFNYTYSHALTDAIGTYNPRYIEDPYDPLLSYGNANFDVRHAITADYVWTVPFARLFGNAPAALTNGWQLSETFTIHSGFPFTVFDSATDSALAAQNYGSSLAAPAYGIFANFMGGRVGPCSGPTTPCLAASQFSSAAGGFGKQALNQFRGPMFVETDFGFMKFTNIRESVKFGVGVQAYNLFNHPNFAVPDPNLADPTFGQIISTVGSPSSIFGVGLGGDNSMRLFQLKAELDF